MEQLSVGGYKINGKVKNFKTCLMQYKAYFPSIIASIVLIIVGQILSPGFASINNIGNILTMASILAIATIGQSIVIISGGDGIDLSVGAIMTMGALIGPMVTRGEVSRLPLALFVLIILGAFVGLVNGVVIQKLKIPALVTTLIMASVVDGFTLGFTHGQPSVTIPTLLLAVGKPLLGPIRTLLVIAVILIIIMELVLRKSVYGRSLYLTGCNRRASQLCGLHVNSIVITTYMAAGIISILAGLLLVGYTGSGQLKMGSDYTLLSIAAVVIGGTKLTGGKGTLVGGALGAIVLILLTSILVAIGMPAGVRSFIQGMTLLIILISNSRAPKLRQ
ncbi:ABC transporter permease [Petroclostridium sp. X23]|uniref:ABC transporter permease n=1 Tax=Petroclostridium sp. X23 TaxID=3045146 RepID=UPI0024AE1071|nr:ABC transporter permease [Petroclostridium sp. X23]WHH59041.1 ABC transporter permease [Petroclostridium sp. X23]